MVTLLLNITASCLQPDLIIFGKPLTEQNLNCILGLDVDGLYRVSGNLAVIQKLRFAVNHGKFHIQ